MASIYLSKIIRKDIKVAEIYNTLNSWSGRVQCLVAVQTLLNHFSTMFKTLVKSVLKKTNLSVCFFTINYTVAMDKKH